MILQDITVEPYKASKRKKCLIALEMDLLKFSIASKISKNFI